MLGATWGPLCFDLEVFETDLDSQGLWGAHVFHPFAHPLPNFLVRPRLVPQQLGMNRELPCVHPSTQGP